MMLSRREKNATKTPAKTLIYPAGEETWEMSKLTRLRHIFHVLNNHFYVFCEVCFWRSNYPQKNGWTNRCDCEMGYIICFVCCGQKVHQNYYVYAFVWFEQTLLLFCLMKSCLLNKRTAQTKQKPSVEIVRDWKCKQNLKQKTKNSNAIDDKQQLAIDATWTITHLFSFVVFKHKLIV